MSLGLAFKAFFTALGKSPQADLIRRALENDAAALPGPASDGAAKPPAAGAEAPTVKKASPKPKPSRSEAIALLSMLQRESRLVDLVQEPLDQFSDAQVGAAARPCLKQCKQVLDRTFSLAPLVDAEEGNAVTVPEEASPIRYQWVGNRAADQWNGTLVHHGWIAETCELSQWTGNPEDIRVIAPAQVQAS